MNDKQEEVLDQVSKLLIEHFDVHVIIVEDHDIDDAGRTSTRSSWYGGVTQVLGLLLHEIVRIGRRVYNKHDETE